MEPRRDIRGSETVINKRKIAIEIYHLKNIIIYS